MEVEPSRKKPKQKQNKLTSNPEVEDYSSEEDNLANLPAKTNEKKDAIKKLREEQAKLKLANVVSKVAVHRCRFIEWQPEGVSAIALHSNDHILAIARDDGDIQICDTESAYHYERKISGSETLAPRSMVWVGDRLISASLFGKITEWSVNTLKEKRSVDSYGGPVWSFALDSRGTTLAAACDDGSLHLFNVADGALDHMRAIPSGAPARLLSVAWNPVRNEVVTGGADGVIRKWDISLNRVTSVITTAASVSKKKSKSIWSVVVLKDSTIVSGDSSGSTSFWDGNLGTLIQAFHEHKSDVLCVAANQKGNFIVSSGVDSRIACFRPTSSDDPNKRWINQVFEHRIHTHDVRSIVISRNFVITSSLDTTVAFYTFEGSASRRVTPFPQKPVIAISNRMRLLLCQQSKKLQIYRMGAAAEKLDESLQLPNESQLNVADDAKLLVEIKPKTNNLSCSALSNDGNYVACADSRSTKLFRLVWTENSVGQIKTKIDKLVLPNKDGATSMIFSPDSTQLIVATSSREVHIYNISVPTQVTLTITLQPESLDEVEKQVQWLSGPAPIVSLSMSSNGKYLAVGDCNNVIHVYEIKNHKLWDTLPIFDSPHTTFNFAPDNKTLAVALANHVLKLYDVPKKELNEWTRNNQKPPTRLRKKNHPTIGIVFNPAQPHMVTLWTEDTFTVIDTSKNMREKTELEDGTIQRTKNFRLIFRYEPLMFLDFLQGNEMIVVERPWVKIMELLPGVFNRPRYET